MTCGRSAAAGEARLLLLAAKELAKEALLLGAAARRAALGACAQALQAASGDLAQVLTREQGKPLEAALSEVMGAAAWFGAGRAATRG